MTLNIKLFWNYRSKISCYYTWYLKTKIKVASIQYFLNILMYKKIITKLIHKFM